MPLNVIEAKETFLSRLKNDTSNLHRALEAHPSISTIMLPDASADAYCRYILLMLQVIKAYEKNVLPKLTTIIPGCEQRKTRHLLEKDLQYMNYIAGSAILKGYTLPHTPVSPSFLLGFMYVMEGSKLGGKVIYRHINKQLGYTEENGAGYIANYGADTFSLWKEFLSAFSTYIIQNNSAEEAIKGARYAFCSIYEFFEQNMLLYEN